MNDNNLGGIAGFDESSLMKYRIGHGVFKSRLLDRYHECQICRIDVPQLLIASHIKPWKYSDPIEKVDPNNGLLLCPNHDRLFDIGLISFSDDGSILVSDDVPYDIYERLKLDVYEPIIINASMKKYLAWHRENIFRNTTLP